ncbi:MAG TPA: uL13 family ribosomal protein [Candidatus Paceibacterota bacterium]|nr:uL13 family ribosomal protein [Candidatus Paceibacterota bacterium]
MTTTYTINAEGRVLGRVASEAAKALMGKNTPDYIANKVADVLVVITNASKTKMSERRMNETLHEKYSGQPGGFKMETNAKIIEKKGWKGLYELAVYGMLPANKLRVRMMKNLTIKD